MSTFKPKIELAGSRHGFSESYLKALISSLVDFFVSIGVGPGKYRMLYLKDVSDTTDSKIDRIEFNGEIEGSIDFLVVYKDEAFILRMSQVSKQGMGVERIFHSFTRKYPTLSANFLNGSGEKFEFCVEEESVEDELKEVIVPEAPKEDAIDSPKPDEFIDFRVVGKKGQAKRNLLLLLDIVSEESTPDSEKWYSGDSGKWYSGQDILSELCRLGHKYKHRDSIALAHLLKACMALVRRNLLETKDVAGRDVAGRIKIFRITHEGKKAQNTPGYYLRPGVSQKSEAKNNSKGKDEISDGKKISRRTSRKSSKKHSLPSDFLENLKEAKKLVSEIPTLEAEVLELKSWLENAENKLKQALLYKKELEGLLK